jgi:alginate O-acetyltransferase complex protein AlgJ
MSIRRRLALVSAAALMTVSPVLATGTPFAHADGDTPPPVYVGPDGIVHPGANVVIRGDDGYLFIGEDFDTACYDGDAFEDGLTRLARLSRLIEHYGKRVVFTVAPNKSSVATDEIVHYPHGRCAKVGVAQQAKALDTFADPHYLPVHKWLASDKRQVYWRTDAHWDTVGSAVYAKHLARMFSPALAKEQHYQMTTRTKLGDLMEYLLTPLPETAPAALPHNGVRTRTKNGSDGFDPVSEVSFDHRWLSSPSAKTWHGDTLLVGDSFTYVGLEALRNLFRTGRFLWTAPYTLPVIVEGIKRADTVVIEVVQRFVTRSPLTTNKFYKQVRAALRK